MSWATRATHSAARRVGPRPSSRLQGLVQPTVFDEFTPLANSLGAVNLGQGFPGWRTPQFVLDHLQQACNDGHTQYTKASGHPELVATLAEEYSRLLGREVKENEVTVTVGATAGMFSTMQALLEDGDEVILFDPAYDAYEPAVRLAGGRARRLPLATATAKDADGAFSVDFEALRQAVNENTKAVVVTTPHNPTGKLLSQKELEQVAAAMEGGAHPDWALVSDEVYEHITFDDAPALCRPATLPSLRDRTITMSSLGKTMSCTGFKVGWCVGPPDVIEAITGVNQWSVFCTTTPMQATAARCLRTVREDGNEFLEELKGDYQRKRDLLVQGIEAAGMRPVVPHGGFFVMADWMATYGDAIPPEYTAFNDSVGSVAAAPDDAIVPLASATMTPDWAFAHYLAREARVVGIPPSAFYSDDNKPAGANFIRLAFCKEDADIEEACERLAAFVRNA